MKKLAILLLGALILCSITACSGVTHCKDCDDKVYQDGYCKYHYAIHYVDDTAKSAFDTIFGD